MAISLLNTAEALEEADTQPAIREVREVAVCPSRSGVDEQSERTPGPP